MRPETAIFAYYFFYSNCISPMKYDFYKENKSDKVWWVYTVDKIGEYLFSFDRKKIYNLFSDYPQKLSPEEKAVFDKENPYWKKFFGA